MDKQPTSHVIVYTPSNVKISLLPSKYLQWQYVRSSYRGYVQVAFSKNKRKCVGCKIWIWMTHLTGIIFYANAESNFKRFVEVGRVVLINDGPFSGKIAVIAEIIDHNRAIIDGPSTGVPRQVFPYKHILLTPIKLTKLPRGAGSGVIRKLVEQEAVVEKWDKSAWAQKRVTREKRKDLNDFDRFKVMLAKKQRRDQVRKALKASA